jgi:hypothetical protein
MDTDAPVVKQGVFLYGGEAVCDVCIQKTNCRFGSGDDEDPLEYRDDVEGEFYYVWYSPVGSREDYRTGGGVFATLAEAIRHVEQSVEGVKWLS